MALARSLAAAALAWVGLAPALAAEPFPNRPIRIVVPTAAGGLADVYGRLVARKMGEHLGQPITVDNRPGADTLLGTRLAKDSPADGYTLLLQASGITVFPYLKENPGYDLSKDFRAVGPFIRSPLMMLVGPDQPDKTLADFVARAQANPGKLSYAHGGIGTPPHIGAAMFLQRAGLRLMDVPYKGNAAAIPDVVGGRAEMIFDAYGTASGLVKQGKIRALGVTSSSRLPSAPDIPTLAEQGYPNFSYYYWLGLLAPAGTPKDVIHKLSEALRYAVTTDELSERFRNDGNEPLVMAPAEFDDYLKTEQDQMAKLIQNLKLPKQ
ncbi:MAG: tripartite tricarboxylate transporter substrate binding protein [Variovorax sp.]|nr:MAG: tripartite tricarboxylate transporter substrate binding protein [Variovorax sp.]